MAVPALASLFETPAEDSAARARNLHQWGALTLFHGLPSDRVRAIAQDADGVMWFGTDGGLARYDGRRTQTVTSHELLAGRVLSLKVDPDGVIWVGTETGAGRFVGEKFELVTGTEGKAITTILTPSPGRTVLASTGALFDCQKRQDGTLDVQTIAEHTLLSIDKGGRRSPLELTSLAAADGALFAGTRGRGLLAIENGAVREVPGQQAFLVEALETDREGQLWFGAQTQGAESGLYQGRVGGRVAKVGDKMTGTVSALRFDGNGDLWVGTDGQGVFRYRGSRRLQHFTFEGTSGALRSDYLYSIFVDREGVVWFGTDRGVCRYDPHSPRNEVLSADVAGNFVRTLFQTKGGRLLCGTNRGLYEYVEADQSWRPIEEFESKTVYAIAEDPQGRLLVGSTTGLYVLPESPREIPQEEELSDDEAAVEDGEEEEEEAPAESVRAIRVFRGVTYLAIYGRGFERLDGERRTLIWPNNSSAEASLQREVTTLHVDGDERLWIGTARAGVFLFDGSKVSAEPALERLRGTPVWAIDGTGERGLWFATANGLYRYGSGELAGFVEGSDVRGVVTSGETSASPMAWCATSGGGLLRVSTDEQFGVLVSRLDVEQGLSSQKAFAILRVRSSQAGDEALLIGTTRGIVRYSPGSAPPVLRPTRILSRRLHPPDELRTGIDLPYPQNSLALDTAALSSRTYPEQFQYAFLLYDGANGRVMRRKISSDSQFLMENLPPGRYRVVARAFTKDLVPSEPLAFQFSVAKAPFPWTTTSLSVLLALSLVALVWGALQNIKIVRTSAALGKANHELASAKLELANEAERERRRIARDLHDQTLADLRSLLLLTDQIPADGTDSNGHNRASFDPTVFRREIESVSNEIRRICEDLSPSVLENVGLTAALEWALANAVSHSPPDCKFEYEFVCDEGLEERTSLAPGVRIQIYRIAQEAINNICRHAAAARVRLTVALSTDGSLVLTLEDDGRDFDPRDKKIRRGRGLANIRARASLIEAEVTWGKRAGGGTVFTLRKADAAKNSPTA